MEVLIRKVRLSRVVLGRRQRLQACDGEGWRVITGLTTQSVRYRPTITTPSESASHSPLQPFNPSPFILIILFRIEKNLWVIQLCFIYRVFHSETPGKDCMGENEEKM